MSKRGQVRRRVNYGRHRNNDSPIMKLLVFGIVVFALLFWVGGMFNYNRGEKPVYNQMNESEANSKYLERQLNKYIESENIEITEPELSYDMSKLSCPEDIFKIVDTIAKQKGLPTHVWYPIVGMESQFNPKTRSVSDTEDSRGLFQINTKVHKDVDKIQVYQPVYNAKYQITKLVPVYEEGLELGLIGVDLVYYTVEHGQKPKLSDPNVQRYVKSAITQYYHELELAEIVEF